MPTCADIYTHIHIYIHIYIYVRMHAHVDNHKCYASTYIHGYLRCTHLGGIHTHMFTSVYTYIHMDSCVCMNLYVCCGVCQGAGNLLISVAWGMHCESLKRIHRQTLRIYIYVYTHVYAHTLIHIHVYVCPCVLLLYHMTISCVYVRVYIQLFVCVFDGLFWPPQLQDMSPALSLKPPALPEPRCQPRHSQVARQAKLQ